MRALKGLGFMHWAEPLFQAISLEAQQALLETHRFRVDRGLIWWKVFCHPFVIYTLAQDPGFLRSTEGSVGAYLVRRLLDYASSNLVHESYLLRLAYDCGLSPQSPLPPYLTPAGFECARKDVDRLEIKCADLRDFAARQHLTTPVKWSLSDVSCWMREEQFHDLLRLVVAGGCSGSRYCFRNFAARRVLPRDVEQRVRRLGAVCDELNRTDSSVIYRFEVGSYSTQDELSDPKGHPDLRHASATEHCSGASARRL